MAVSRVPPERSGRCPAAVPVNDETGSPGSLQSTTVNDAGRRGREGSEGALADRSMRVGDRIRIPFTSHPDEHDRASSVVPATRLTKLKHRSGGHVDSRTNDARGWPCRSLWCEISYGKGRHTVQGGIETSLTPFLGALPRCLPLRPLWLGFTINTAVYAALLGVPLWLVPMLRRAWRRKQQRCPNCGYEIGPGGQSRCPECGKAVRPERPIGT